MHQQPKWQYDEMKQIGTDYTDPDEIAAYDRRQQQYRDTLAESKAIVERLGLGADQTVLDMGSGTGAFALHAAGLCAKVYAVDVSEPMLSFVRERAEQTGLSNIEFHHGGFLTYEHEAEPVDAIVSQIALHHLPDAWKLIGLTRLAGNLTTGGRLYLKDLVFTFDPADYRRVFDEKIRDFAQATDPEFASQLETHIRQEFSTLDWIMEGILRRAGFTIDLADYRAGLAEYLCTKESRL